MAFSNDVVGGTTLLRPAIRSPNYVAGVSGWTINRDGTSEFAGGTFRGPVVVIDPSTGVVLASIGADGNISAQNFYATGDVIIGTLSVLSAIEAAGRGVVARVNIKTALPTVPASSVLADICWIGWNVDHTRQYALRSDAAYFQQDNLSNEENVTFNLVVAQPGGLSGTVFNEVIGVRPSAFKLPTENFMLPTFSADGPATIKLQATTNSSSTYTIETDTSNGWNLWIEDIGPRVATGSGGSGTPSGGSAHSKQYFATVSQSYVDASISGNPIPSPDGINNMYQGKLSGRNNGNEFAVWSLPGSTIRSDLAGATIQSAKLWMYCTNSSGASGGAFIGWTADTTPQGSYPSGVTLVTPTPGNQTSNWPVPGWGSVDVTGAISAILSNGANSVFVGHATIDGSASFYGFGTSAFIPYLQVNYTV